MIFLSLVMYSFFFAEISLLLMLPVVLQNLNFPQRPMSSAHGDVGEGVDYLRGGAW
jgi:hypothetical protein